MTPIELTCWSPLEGVLAVALAVPAAVEVAAASLTVGGGAPSGGWLFHRGRLADGRRRCTWIGRAPAGPPPAVAVALPGREIVRAAATPASVPGPELPDYAAEYPALADRLGLARQLVESAPAILKLKGMSDFERLRRQVLERLLAGVPEPAPTAVYQVSDRLRLLLFADGTPLPEAAAVHVMQPGGLQRSPFAPVRLGTAQALLVAAEFAPGEATLALLGPDAGARVRLPRAADLRGRGDLLGEIHRLSSGFDLGRYLVIALAPYRGSEPRIAELVRELGLLMPAVAPVATRRDGPVTAELELAVATASGTLLLGGRLEDPHGLVDHAEWRVPGGAAVRLPPAALRPLHGAPAILEEADGTRRVQVPRHFLAVAAAPSAAAHLRQHGLELVLRSGARVALTSPRMPAAAAERRDLLLGFLKRIDPDDALLDAVAPVVAALHAEHLARDRVAESFEVGRPRRRPEVTVVVPLYRVLSFLRLQASAFAADRHARDAEFIAVLDSPEQRDELRHALVGLEAAYGIAWRVLVHTANLGYAPAVNTGAAAARGRTLVLLNSDVVPAGDRWLPAMRARLASAAAVGAVGPKLLYGDDSLQHAGLTFAVDDQGRYYNTHFHKGYPRDFPPANRARRVPALTGACIMVGRRQFEAVGGIAEDYVVGDFEDSDFSLRLAAAGRELWYEPAAELYHYERESIVHNRSYADTAACRFNQHLHTRRWLTQLQNAVEVNPR